MKYALLSLLLLVLSCSDRPPTTPETRPVENPNAGNTAIYDVDPDDPYEIGDGSFLDMRPGSRVAEFSKLLRPDSLRDGKNTSSIYRIIGRKKEELGYVHMKPQDTEVIDFITITSPDVVTEDGIRVGNSYAELVERLGKVHVEGSEKEAKVFASQGALRYRLNVANNQYDLDATQIDPTTPITQIEIH